MRRSAAFPHPTIRRQLASSFAALKIDDVRKRLSDGGSEIVGNSPEAVDSFLREEVEKWASVVRAANVKHA